MSLAKDKVFKEFYKVIENFGYAAIVFDKKTGRLEYLVIEPELSDYEKKALKKIKEFIIEASEPDLEALENREALERYIKKQFEKALKKYKIKINPASKDKLLYYLIRDLVGYGDLEVLMRDPNIEDISCDGVGLPVYVWHRRYESIPTNVKYETEEELLAILNKLAYKAGKQISVAFPIVEGSLPEGYRIHLTLSEVSRRGGTFTIRKFREEPYTIIDLIKFKTVSTLLAAYFWLLVDLKRSLMILGATGSGKTTTLNAIAMFIRPEAKIVTIEDTPEINLPHENWIPLVTRPSHEAWRMDVTLYELLRTALRQRPDYIIVGEVRGEEAYTLFQAIASVSGDVPILLYDEKSGSIMLERIGKFVDQFYEKSEERIPKYLDGKWRVLTFENGRIVFRPIKYVLRHRVDHIYEIEYENYGRILATGSHSVFVLDEGDLTIKEKKVAELKKGDLLISFCKIRPFKYTSDSLVIDLVDLLRDDDEVKIRVPLYLGATEYKELKLKDYVSQETNIYSRVQAYLRCDKERIPALLKLDKNLALVIGTYLATGSIAGKNIVILKTNNGYVSRITNYLKNFGIEIKVHTTRETVTIYAYSALLVKILSRLSESELLSYLWMASHDIINELIKGFNSVCQKKYLDEGTISRIVWLGKLYGLDIKCDKSKNVILESYLKSKIPSSIILKVLKVLRNEGIKIDDIIKELENKGYVNREEARAILRRIEVYLGELRTDIKDLILKLRDIIEGEIVVYRVLKVVRRSYSGYVYDVSVPRSEAFFGGYIPILLHNTGHAGLSTMHAENVHYAIRRLETRPMNVPRELIPMMNVFVEIARIERRGTVFRRIIGVYETLGVDTETGEVKLHQVFKWDPISDQILFTGKSPLLEEIAKRGIYLVGNVMEELKVREAILRRLVERDIRSFREVAKVLRDYYYRPEEVKRRLLIG